MVRISDAARAGHWASYHDGVTTQPSSRENAPAPRESATVLLLRDEPFEVLMVSRAARGAFASALVFPGGAIDPDDRHESWRTLVDDFDGLTDVERGLRIGALREVWEETGILVSSEAAPPRTGASLRDALTASGLRVRLDALTPFAHWITPVAEPRRFDTHFYLAAVDRHAHAEPDGVETLATEWLGPAEAAELARGRKRPIIFPTMLNLLRLAESEGSAHAIAVARSRPVVTVTPDMDVLADGTRRVRIPSDAGYSVHEWTDRS